MLSYFSNKKNLSFGGNKCKTHSGGKEAKQVLKAGRRRRNQCADGEILKFNERLRIPRQQPYGRHLSCVRFGLLLCWEETVKAVLVKLYAASWHHAKPVWCEQPSAATTQNFESKSEKTAQLQVFLCLLRSAGCGDHLDLVWIQKINLL